MDFENIDLVFNSRGECIYTNLPSNINQYANNYKLRVGIASELMNIKTVTANIKTTTTMPTRLLMIVSDEKDHINANGVIIREVYSYTFSQYDTKAFQDYMMITVNILTQEETIFNHTINIPMMKSAYSTETARLFQEDGTLSSFVEAVYDNLNDIVKRLNTLETIIDPDTTTNNPEIIERLETNIQKNSNDISTLSTSTGTQISNINTNISNLQSSVSLLDSTKFNKTGGIIEGQLIVDPVDLPDGSAIKLTRDNGIYTPTLHIVGTLDSDDDYLGHIDMDYTDDEGNNYYLNISPYEGITSINPDYNTSYITIKHNQLARLGNIQDQVFYDGLHSGTKMIYAKDFGRNGGGYFSCLLSIRYSTRNTSNSSNVPLGSSLYYITSAKDGNYYYMTIQALATTIDIIDNTNQPSVTIASNGTANAHIKIDASTKVPTGLSRGFSYAIIPLIC